MLTADGFYAVSFARVDPAADADNVDARNLPGLSGGQELARRAAYWATSIANSADDAFGFKSDDLDFSFH